MMAVPEFRRDPDDGQVCSLDELHKKYRSDFTVEEVRHFWNRECEVVQPKGRAGERRTDPEDNRVVTWEDLWRRSVLDFTTAEILEYWNSECSPLEGLSPAQAIVVHETKQSPRQSWLLWAREVDLDGSFDNLAISLASSYSHPSQLAEAYVLESPGKARSLDPHVFHDVGVQGERDVRLLRAWFARACGTEPEKSAPVHRKPTAPMADKPKREAPALRGNAAMKQWLLEVDSEGSLLAPYLELLSENFDSVSQITDTYVSRRRCQNGSRRVTFSHEFFTDLLIEDEAHCDLFVAWFHERFGAHYEEPPPPPPPPPPREPVVEESDASHCYWPQDLPREQQNRARRLMHSCVQPWYPRERVHGPTIERASDGVLTGSAIARVM